MPCHAMPHPRAVQFQHTFDTQSSDTLVDRIQSILCGADSTCQPRSKSLKPCHAIVQLIGAIDLAVESRGVRTDLHQLAAIKKGQLAEGSLGAGDDINLRTWARML